MIASRIARMDYPRDWLVFYVAEDISVSNLSPSRPDVLPQLVQSVEAPDTTNDQEIKIVHDRAFEMLYEVLLGLSSRPLSAARKQFAEVAPRVFQTAANAYVIYTKSTIQELSKLSASINSTESLSLELNIATMCVKCLRILLVNGIRDVHKYDETKKFIEMSKIHIQELLQQRMYPALKPMQPISLYSNHTHFYIRCNGSATMCIAGKFGESDWWARGAVSGVTKSTSSFVRCVPCMAWYPCILLALHITRRKSHQWTLQTRHVENDVVMFNSSSNLNYNCMIGEPMNISIYEQFLLQGMLLIKDTIRNFGLSTDSSSKWCNQQSCKFHIHNMSTLQRRICCLLQTRKKCLQTKRAVSCATGSWPTNLSTRALRRLYLNTCCCRQATWKNGRRIQKAGPAPSNPRTGNSNFG